jgi:hypothetical protein
MVVTRACDLAHLITVSVDIVRLINLCVGAGICLSDFLLVTFFLNRNYFVDSELLICSSLPPLWCIMS